MSNFLVIIPSKGNFQEGKEVFRQGVQFAKTARQQIPSEQLESNWAFVATFPRINGSLCPLIQDQESGDWVLVSGTWFHPDGWGSGNEQRLLARLQEVGSEKVAKELEGFFVFVYGKERTKELSVATDIIGSCHAFQRISPDFLAVSGSSLILAGLSSVLLDPIACQEFLCTGVTYEDRTFYQEVRKIAPATVSTSSEGKVVSVQTYWSIEELTPESLDGYQAIEHVAQNLIGAVKTITKAFPAPVCDLTGGYDSRSVVAAFLGAKVSLQTTVSGSPDTEDVQVSNAIASKFRLSHRNIAVSPQSSFEDLKKILFLTDGEYNILEYVNVFQVHRILMEQYDVSINGSFGEIGRGYWWELLFPNPAKIGKLDGDLVARKRYTVQRFDECLFEPSKRLDLAKHFGKMIDRINSGLWNSPQSFQMDHAYLRMRMQQWQGRIASSTNQIWPCLSPFMFRSVLEPLLQIRSSFRRRNQFASTLIQSLQPTLANMPLEHGWPALPFRWNTAHKFWPLPILLGKKVVQRISGRNVFFRPPPKELGPMAAQRLKLWEERNLRDLLNPSEMNVGHILDGLALKQFIQASKEACFPYESQWANLMTMELTLSQLKLLR